MDAVTAFLKENYYSIAVTVFVASLVYLLVFDEKESDVVEEKAVGEEQNPRVVSATAKKIEAEKENAKVIAAEQEEQDYVQEQRNMMKQGAAPHVPPANDSTATTTNATTDASAVLAPLMVVPNALVYGITLGNVNLMDSPTSSPAK